MAIFIESKAPDRLLDVIKEKLASNNDLNWVCDGDGDFTCSVNGMIGQAWFHPYKLDNFLAFGIIGRNDVFLSNAVFSKYHSEFLHCLLLYFGSYVSSIIIKTPFENELDTKKIENNFNII